MLEKINNSTISEKEVKMMDYILKRKAMMKKISIFAYLIVFLDVIFISYILFSVGLDIEIMYYSGLMFLFPFSILFAVIFENISKSELNQGDGVFASYDDMSDIQRRM